MSDLYGGHDVAWMSDGLCTQTWPDLWFPEDGDSRAARAICNGTDTTDPCPVAAKCLTYALDNSIRDGVFGGLSAKQRKKLKARINKEDAA